jgi:tetratricopeptide (TPR) repeat protein
MNSQAMQANCRCCGAIVQATENQCSYCGNPIRITTLRSAAELSKPVLMKYLRNYEAAGPESNSSHIALGLIYLQIGQFAHAKDRFNKVIELDPINAEAYFYRAIAVLQNKKPFLCPRSLIDEALCDLDAAYEIEQQAVYKYVSALIRYDYFYRKKFRIVPDFADEFEIAKSTGIGSGDMDLLRSVINVNVIPELQL